MAQIQSGASADLATVDADSNAIRSRLYGNTTPISAASGADIRTREGLIQAINNDGNARLLRGDRFGSTALANQTPLITEPFEATVISANRWVATATTMAAAQTALGLTLNSGSITTINTGIFYASRKLFPRIMRAPLQYKIRARIVHYPNSVAEFGFGSGNTAAASPNVGAYFQVTSGGVLQPVLTYNGVDLTGSSITYSTSNYYTFDVLLDDDGATFIVQDTSTGLIINEQSIALPLTQGRLANVTHIPVFFALRNTGVAPATAPQVIITDLYVGMLDAQLNSSWQHRAAQMGYNSIYQPVTFAQAETFTNSAEPASATLSNTAAGYTTLGGKFQFAAVAGAVTDYCLFGFTVPAPYQFVCTGIDIDVWNTVAAVATTPTLLQWGIGVNGATANLGTGAHIRKMVGAQSLPIGTVPGGMADRTITKKFDTPLVCESGLNFAIILRMPVATATATEVIAGLASVNGYFE